MQTSSEILQSLQKVMEGLNEKKENAEAKRREARRAEDALAKAEQEALQLRGQLDAALDREMGSLKTDPRVLRSA